MEALKALLSYLQRVIKALYNVMPEDEQWDLGEQYVSFILFMFKSILFCNLILVQMILKGADDITRVTYEETMHTLSALVLLGFLRASHW